MSGARRRVLGGERGQSLVEFALVVPVVLLLLVGAVDFGRGFHAYVQLGNAVREAAREASVHGAGATTPWGPTANDARVQTAVRDRATGLVSGQISVTSSWPSGNRRGSEVVVGATYTFTPIALSLVGNVTLPLSVETRLRIHN